MTTYTNEALLNASTRSKVVGTGKGVLTKQEAQERVSRNGRLEIMTEVGAANGRNAFFFVDDYCLGQGILPDRFVPSSCNLPMSVTPRVGLPSGKVTNVDEYLTIFRSRVTDHPIESLDDLVAYLNETAAHEPAAT